MFAYIVKDLNEWDGRPVITRIEIKQIENNRILSSNNNYYYYYYDSKEEAVKKVKEEIKQSINKFKEIEKWI